jgi:GT2 family glycosyltransferase
MQKVQIIIPCINLWAKYTKPCIDSVVKACKGIDHRILLVDNGSFDETKIEAGKLVSDTFSHKRFEINEGCSRAWNFGINDAFERGYTHVLVLNNDVLIHPESIEMLLARFRVEPEVAMATMMDITGECVTPGSIFNKDKLDKIGVLETEHPCFSGFMINRKCWEIVGEFDEGFYPAYYEDNDYHRRINLSGMIAIVCPLSLFYHYGSRTTLEALPRKIDSSQAHRYFVEKWGGNPDSESLYKQPFNNMFNGIDWTKQSS